MEKIDSYSSVYYGALHGHLTCEGNASIGLIMETFVKSPVTDTVQTHKGMMFRAALLRDCQYGRLIGDMLLAGHKYDIHADGSRELGDGIVTLWFKPEHDSLYYGFSDYLYIDIGRCGLNMDDIYILRHEKQEQGILHILSLTCTQDSHGDYKCIIGLEHAESVYAGMKCVIGHEGMSRVTYVSMRHDLIECGMPGCLASPEEQMKFMLDRYGEEPVIEYIKGNKYRLDLGWYCMRHGIRPEWKI